MKWSHLPVPGGLYDQHPALLEAWRKIFAARAEHDRAEEAKRDQKRPGQQGQPRRPPRRR